MKRKSICEDFIYFTESKAEDGKVTKNYYDELVKRHKKSNKRGARGTFVRFTGNPEKEKDLFNKAMGTLNNSENAEVSATADGASTPCASTCCAESCINEAGYHNYSMSNNAVDAYNSGEMPFSKWTKSEILDAVKKLNPDKISLVNQLPVSALKSFLLVKSSWHHTGKMYNETNFYSISEEKLDSLTQEIVDKLKERHAEIKQEIDTAKKAGPVIRKGRIDYIEWEGTLKHPRAVPQRLDNVNIEERGQFYIVTTDGGREILRKKKNSRGTYVTYLDK